MSEGLFWIVFTFLIVCGVVGFLYVATNAGIKSSTMYYESLNRCTDAKGQWMVQLNGYGVCIFK